MLSGNRKWQATWHGHVIEVRNGWRFEWSSLNLTGLCTLTVDGIELDRSTSVGPPPIVLSGGIDIQRRKVAISAVLGARRIIFVGCKIFADGALVGGDIHSRLTDYMGNPLD